MKMRTFERLFEFDLASKKLYWNTQYNLIYGTLVCHKSLKLCIFNGESVLEKYWRFEGDLESINEFHRRANEIFRRMRDHPEIRFRLHSTNSEIHFDGEKLKDFFIPFGNRVFPQSLSKVVARS